jgi:hypothetical protein
VYYRATKNATEKAVAECYSMSAVSLDLAMAKLWEDHITWTRNYIISDLADLGDKAAVAERLLKNQDDLGNAVKPFYGKEAGDKLAALLKDHILIATEVVAAAKAGKTNDLKAASKKWYANADDIAKLLGEANPRVPLTIIKSMLYKHLEYTTGEVTSRLKGDWKADIEFYDKGHAHMLMLSKALCDEIHKQFPAKFGR